MVGEGGMGRVWAARQVGSPLQRLVAVKTAISGQSQTPEFQRLFMDEARIASLIHHPHVCGVYELGEEKGTLYLVMEWCDGGSLRQVMDLLPNGRMDLQVVARIVANVAAGLHAAHELEDSDGTKLRVVHRDVSPQNILISKNGHVKVADFGVAKAQGQLHRPTETGEMKGKLAYMAPEQVTAKDIDHRADIFALGCVLYEVSVGKRPFQGEGALSTLYQLLEQKVAAPTEIVEGFPPALSAIVLRALEKDPADRYQTAEDLRIALEGWLAASGSSVSEREIAAVVKVTLGLEIEDKSKKINEASARLKDLPPEELGSEDVRNSHAPSTDTGSRRREGAITEDRGVATGTHIREKSSWWLPVGAGLAVLGIVVVLAKGSLGLAPPPPAPLASTLTMPAPSVAAPSVSSEPTQPTPDPEPAATVEARAVKITVRTIPPNATIRIDDGNAVSAPYSVEIAPSAEQRVITASAPNYQSVTRQVSFDQTREIVLELDRLQRQVRRHRTNAEPSPAARDPEAAAEPPPKPREPVGPGRRPRALDEANPFSG
jgi:serine/threonine-protein kinase